MPVRQLKLKPRHCLPGKNKVKQKQVEGSCEEKVKAENCKDDGLSIEKGGSVCSKRSGGRSVNRQMEVKKVISQGKKTSEDQLPNDTKKIKDDMHSIGLGCRKSGYSSKMQKIKNSSSSVGGVGKNMEQSNYRITRSPVTQCSKIPVALISISDPRQSYVSGRRSKSVDYVRSDNLKGYRGITAPRSKSVGHGVITVLSPESVSDHKEPNMKQKIGQKSVVSVKKCSQNEKTNQSLEKEHNLSGSTVQNMTYPGPQVHLRLNTGRKLPVPPLDKCPDAKALLSPRIIKATQQREMFGKALHTRDTKNKESALRKGTQIFQQPQGEERKKAINCQEQEETTRATIMCPELTNKSENTMKKIDVDDRSDTFISNCLKSESSPDPDTEFEYSVTSDSNSRKDSLDTGPLLHADSTETVAQNLKPQSMASTRKSATHSWKSPRLNKSLKSSYLSLGDTLSFPDDSGHCSTCGKSPPDSVFGDDSSADNLSLCSECEGEEAADRRRLLEEYIDRRQRALKREHRKAREQREELQHVQLKGAMYEAERKELEQDGEQYQLKVAGISSSTTNNGFGLRKMVTKGVSWGSPNKRQYTKDLSHTRYDTADKSSKEPQWHMLTACESNAIVVSPDTTTLDFSNWKQNWKNFVASQCYLLETSADDVNRLDTEYNLPSCSTNCTFKIPETHPEGNKDDTLLCNMTDNWTQTLVESATQTGRYSLQSTNSEFAQSMQVSIISDSNEFVGYYDTPECPVSWVEPKDFTAYNGLKREISGRKLVNFVEDSKSKANAAKFIQDNVFGIIEISAIESNTEVRICVTHAHSVHVNANL